MKTTIQTIERTICKHYKGVKIRNYYVEDTSEIYQKVVIYGIYYDYENNENHYLYGSIIGKNKTEEEIMEEINCTDNRYEAKYNFYHYIN